MVYQYIDLTLPRCDAYKHIPVCEEDKGLQCFKVADKYFCDTKLSFGGSTSPPLYDYPAELVLQLSLWEAGVDRRHALRQLDDILNIGTWDEVSRAYKATREVCADIGVKLADENDPDKAFPPSKKGTILGLDYSIDDWQWKLNPQKADRIVELLFLLIENDKVRNDAVKSLLGKLNHYACIFGGKFERTFIQKVHEDTAPKIKMVPVTRNARSQAGWWIRAVYAASVFNCIPGPTLITSAKPILIYGDAAGGQNGGYGAAVCLPSGELFYTLGKWTENMKRNKDFLGKLTFLEALASLSGLLLAPDKIRNKHVQVIILHGMCLFTL